MKVQAYTTRILVVVFLAFSVAGCDKLMPKPKAPAVKKQEAAAVAAPAPVAVAAPAQEPVVTVSDEKLPNDVLATVGDWTLTVADFDERVKNIKQVVQNFDEKNIESKKMLIDELIRQQLMVTEARRQKLNETKEFQTALKDFENNILLQELVTGLTKDIKVSDEEAKDYYDKNPDIFIKPVEKKVSEIVVLTEAEAKDILAQVAQGTDFAQLAKDKSKGKTAAAGGDLGFIEKAPFEQMAKAVEITSKGNVSGVFQGPDGYYIIKVDDVRGGDKVTLEEVKADLIKGLTAQKQQKVVFEKMAEVAKQVKVKVNTDLLNVQPGE